MLSASCARKLSSPPEELIKGVFDVHHITSIFQSQAVRGMSCGSFIIIISTNVSLIVLDRLR